MGFWCISPLNTDPPFLLGWLGQYPLCGAAGNYRQDLTWREGKWTPPKGQMDPPFLCSVLLQRQAHSDSCWQSAEAGRTFALPHSSNIWEHLPSIRCLPMVTDSAQTGCTQTSSFHSFACPVKVHRKLKIHLSRCHSTWKGRSSLATWQQGMYPPIYQENGQCCCFSDSWGGDGEAHRAVPQLWSLLVIQPHLCPSQPPWLLRLVPEEWVAREWGPKPGSQSQVEASFPLLHGLALLSPLRPQVCSEM